MTIVCGVVICDDDALVSTGAFLFYTYGCCEASQVQMHLIDSWYSWLV